jgi:hypothetical protein
MFIDDDEYFPDVDALWEERCEAGYNNGWEYVGDDADDDEDWYDEEEDR